jgi:hypothetical protein
LQLTSDTTRTLTSVFFGILGRGSGLDAKVVLKGRSQMPAPPRKRHLGAEQRRALRLLASSPFGVSEATMFALRRMLASLIRAGLATAQRENIETGSPAGRVRITEAGRRAIEG